MWFFGGNTIEGSGCFMFAQWSKWAPNLMEYVQSVAENLTTEK